MDGSVLHVADSTEEALEVLRPVSSDESIFRGGSDHQNSIRQCGHDKWAHTLLSGHRRALHSHRDQHIAGSSTPSDSTTHSVLLSVCTIG